MSDTKKGVLQQMKTFVYRWKIERFFGDCEKVGDSYTSPVFLIDCCDKVTKWYLKVYPNGNHEGCKDFVSLFLYFKSENASDSMTVDYQLSIVSKQNALLQPLSRQAKLFTITTDSWGLSTFANQNFIKNANTEALVNDTLTIQCEITFSDQAATRNELKVYNSLLNNIGKGFDDYEVLLEGNHFSDVTFNVQDNKMHLHKAILMCRNSVFKAMFKKEKRTGKRQKLMDVVEITDVAYGVMKEVFRFIYSGKVENIDEIAKDLLIAADKYAIPELKALCEKTLYNNLTVDNAIEFFKLTDVCDTLHLKSLVMEFIAAHCKDIAKKPGFADLNSQVMHQIIQLITEKD